MTVAARLSRHSTALAVTLLAALAYLPALASSPGRMPADTKLFLYFDPARLLGRAASTFEPDQFAGWVPHQQITYLWPSGPWYLLFETIGVPDWVAHRLWIGTILFLAGAGVLWAGRLLGLSALGALGGAIAYQLSPFVLPYISRTSLLLLPWMAVGWIVALTIRATAARSSAGWRGRLTTWRDPALIALVVMTVGSANATTLAMIVPAPVLWILHTAWRRDVSWRRALAVAARVSVLCVAVSLWWIAMLAVQSRHGAPVLAYSETLVDVSRNATGSEVLRGLGYWLFYQRDPFGPTTTASIDHLLGLRTIAAGYAVIIVGLAGLALTSWRHRRFAAMCAAAGIVLAVGVHPVDDPSPLMSLLVDDDGSGLALALRSSTRAVPVLLFGVALGIGALLSALGADVPLRSLIPRRARHRLRTDARLDVRLLATFAVAVLAAVSLPSLWQRAFVDPVIDRDQDPPPAWDAAVDRLDQTGTAARVLQLPGAEFGAFRWGYTVDPPLVGLSDKPLVTRDLLPLGSAGAMDLLFALDDRFQEGTVEPASLAPIARLLGSDVVWLSNDAAFERFRTARPEIVDALLTAEPPPDGLGSVERFGDPVPNVPERAMLDPAALVEDGIGRPLSPVALVPVVDPVPVIRAKTRSVVLSGSGDGLVDAAAAGLLSGHELVRSSAALDAATLDEAVAESDLLIVTDSNRDQAHHWRGSQDVRGHTEPGGADIDVLEPTSADQRLDVFPPDPATQTIALQDGPVTATASSYGDPFSYLPEDRAVFAIDGDAATAWTVADHGDPLGERIRLTLDDGVEQTLDGAPLTSLRLAQPIPPPGGRSIASVRISVDDQPGVDVALDDSSRSVAGQQVTIPAVAPGGSLTIEITGVVPGQFPLAASFGGVGFAEIDLGVGPTTEVIRLPVDGLAAAAADTPIAVVMTRWRTDPTDPWRSDPEPHLVRRFELTDSRTLEPTVTLRLDRRAAEALLADVLGGSTATASSRVAGGVEQRGAAALDGDESTAWVTGFDEALGATLRFDADAPLGGELTIVQPEGPYSPVTAVQITTSSGTAELALPAPDADGRSTVVLPDAVAAATGPVELTITGIDTRTTIDRRFGDPRTVPAALAEVRADGIRPEAVDRDVIVSAECSPDFLLVDGEPLPVSFTATVGDLLDGTPVTAVGCAPLSLGPGNHLLSSDTGVESALVVDRVVLSEPGAPSPAPPTAAVQTLVTRDEPRARDVTVAACPDGCWLVLGDGWNPAWKASVNGVPLGRPEAVDGGFNGWRLPPSDAAVDVELRWSAQRPVTVGLTLSALAALACLALVVLAARTTTTTVDRATSSTNPTWPYGADPVSVRHAVITGAVAIVGSAVLIAPVWGVVALVPAAVSIGAAATARRLPRVYESIGLLAAVVTAASVLWITRRDRPFPDAGWTAAFDHLNGVALFAVVAIAVGAMFGPDAYAGTAAADSTDDLSEARRTAHSGAGDERE